MKKILLFIFLFLVSNSFFAQITTPPDLTACGLGGAATFDLTINQPIILSTVSNPNDYTVTYHETQLDAENSTTVISNPSSFTNINNPQIIYVRVENIETSEAFFTSFAILVNNIPMPLNIALFWCNPMELAIYNLNESIPQILNDESQNATFYETLTDAEFNSNPIPNSTSYIPIQVPIQTLFVRVEDFNTGCFAISTVDLNTNNCNQFCSAPIQLTLSNVTDTSATINWSSEPNTSVSHWRISIVPIGQQPNENTTIISQLNSFTVTGLNQNTCYSFYVRAICSGIPGDFQVSEWSVPLEFCLMDCTNNGQCPEQLNLIAFIDENNNS
ncbi:MAG: hypothetical protein CVU07_06160, partial [Bacteroidetes bacterium HGW-Bacteroidetes-23]